jgi:hypothetical protein
MRSCCDSDDDDDSGDDEDDHDDSDDDDICIITGREFSYNDVRCYVWIARNEDVL